MTDSPGNSEQSTTRTIAEPESSVNLHKNANRLSLRDRLEDTRILRPLVIFLGPIPAVCIWIFFAFTFIRSVVLPDPMAPVVREHHQSTTMSVSTIATVIAIYVSL
jgi:hypothetical protein